MRRLVRSSRDADCNFAGLIVDPAMQTGISQARESFFKEFSIAVKLIINKLNFAREL